VPTCSSCWRARWPVLAAPAAEAGTLEKARAVGYLAGLSLKAIEAGNLAARLEALEAALKLRGSGGRTP
jgi:hypothetical protein